MERFINLIVEAIISNFDFGFMFVVNVATYIIIKCFDKINGINKVLTWQKRLILIFCILLISGIYIICNYDKPIILINSSILAPVFWSWVVSPIIKKFGIGYKDIDETLN